MSAGAAATATHSQGGDRRIRVLQVMDKCAIRGSPIHGVSRLLLTWWPAFRETEFDFSLCVLRGGGGTCNAFADMGVEVHDLSRHKLDPRTLPDLVRLIRKLDIQIVHCHGYGATTFGRMAGALCKVPVIVQEHMIDAKIPPYQRLADFLLAPLTTSAVAVSQAVARFMRDRRFIPAHKLSVVYNTIPADYCREYSAEEKAAIRRRLGLPEDRPLIGIIGRLDPIKGHEDFLAAAARIREAHPRAFFVVAGDGELRQRLEQRAGELGLEEHIAFLGHRDDIMDITAVLAVFVSCSHSEGLPMAHAEAMVLGVPVVATAVGGVPEIVEDGVSGLLVPPGRPQEIAAAVSGLLADESRRERIAAAGRQRCRERFLVPRTVEALGALYHQVLAAKATASG